jgi:hypothetical protein
VHQILYQFERQSGIIKIRLEPAQSKAKMLANQRLIADQTNASILDKYYFLNNANEECFYTPCNEETRREPKKAIYYEITETRFHVLFI